MNELISYRIRYPKNEIIERLIEMTILNNNEIPSYELIKISLINDPEKDSYMFKLIFNYEIF